MMSSNTKIATLNLCLGLKTKKEEVKRLIIENNIDILCVQESEIIKGYPTELLTFKGYNYENETNDLKSRCGVYVSNRISYTRRQDLEIKNMHVIILDVNDTKKHRIINIYRSFNPQSTSSQKQFFEAQLLLIQTNITSNTIILGDFNLDQNKIYNPNYSHKLYFEALNTAFQPHNLMQIVDFDTWSRIINNETKSSLIDHVYVKDPTSFKNLSAITPPFGDHKLISFTTTIEKIPLTEIFKRNWKNYSKEALLTELSKQNWLIKKDSVQSFWNEFESKLVEIVDIIAPLQPLHQIEKNRSRPPPHIKNKLNKRNRLLKKLKNDPSHETRSVIKQLNKEIKQYFYIQKSNQVRRSILPGNSKSLWDAVRIAKDQNAPALPDNMSVNETIIENCNLPTEFAKFF